MSIVTCRSHRSREAAAKRNPPSTESLFHYIGGVTGSWRVSTIATLSGHTLPPVTHVEIATGVLDRPPAGTAWVLNCIASNTRFVTREDARFLTSDSPRASSFNESCAALVLVRKSQDWWNLALGEQREILDLPSRKARGHLSFLPAIMRRMQYRSRMEEPFDFVTWFEYASQDASVFDDLVAAMRSSEEWQHIEREVVIKLVRETERKSQPASISSPRRAR